MKKHLVFLVFVVTAIISFILTVRILRAQTPEAMPTLSPVSYPTVEPVVDSVNGTKSVDGSLENLLKDQKLGPVFPLNFVKYAIRSAVSAGVPANTMVFLLLLPVVSFVIALSRNVVGIKGFGIFLPAALSVTFVAMGPILGIFLFLVITIVSTAVRIFLRRFNIKLQYLPRMSLILWFVAVGVLGVLFLSPVIRNPQLSNVSIFAVLVLTLLVEDFIKVQLGKSIKTALDLTFETLLLAIVSYFVLTFKPLQELALLKPELLLVTVFLLNILLGKYIGLRLMEIWRFRKLLKQ